jgi:subtilisin-like proprotein convertase family protein
VGPHPEAEPAGTARFADFAGIDPNGVWSLYVVDDAGSDPGTLGGWTLRIGTAVAPECEACMFTPEIFSDGFE